MSRDEFFIPLKFESVALIPRIRLPLPPPWNTGKKNWRLSRKMVFRFMREREQDEFLMNKELRVLPHNFHC